MGFRVRALMGGIRDEGDDALRRSCQFLREIPLDYVKKLVLYEYWREEN